MPIKRTGKRRITGWDKILKIQVGAAGIGKSHPPNPPFAKDIISQSANPLSKTTSYQNINSGDNTGSWTSPNTDQPYTSQPYQNPYLPTTNEFPYQWQMRPWYQKETTPSISPPKEKPKHDPKEMVGKLVAYATVRVQGIEHTGVLFVRRCGAWKLIDCRTMNKVASGTEKEPLPDVTIHYIIYAEETDTRPKKKSRFDDIGMHIDEEIDKDGTET